MAINISLNVFGQWKKVAFCTALLERMLPSYKMFAESSGFGDYAILRNQQDLLWQWLANRNIKINVEAQLLKLEEQIPDPDEFDSFGVFPALDASMALMSTLQGLRSLETEDFDDVSRLSKNSVSYYIELLLAQDCEDDDEITIQPQDIEQHPLMQWEAEMQTELFNFLVYARENKEACAQLKNIAIEEGLSNLGIEI